MVAMVARLEGGCANAEDLYLPGASRSALSRWALVPSPSRATSSSYEARSPCDEVVVRHTFLTVPETSEHTPKRRANSAPPPPDSCDREADALCALTYKPRPIDRPKVSACNIEAASETTTAPDVDVASTAASEEVVDRPYMSPAGGQSGYLLSQPFENAVGNSGSSGDWHQQNQGGFPAGGMVDNQAQIVPRDARGIPTSIGSIGHMQGICKPCVFAHHSQKVCGNGVMCQFCHFEHPPKQKRRLCRQRGHP